MPTDMPQPVEPKSIAVRDDLKLAYTVEDAWLRDKRQRIFSITEKGLALLAITAGWAVSTDVEKIQAVEFLVYVTIVLVAALTAFYIWTNTLDYKHRSMRLKRIIVPQLSDVAQVRSILSPFEGERDDRSLHRAVGHSAAIAGLAFLCLALVHRRIGASSAPSHGPPPNPAVNAPAL